MYSLQQALFLLALGAVGAKAWTTITVPNTGGSADDTPGLVAAIANVSANATILFEKGVTYNIFTPITFPEFTNVEVSIQGNLTYPANITAVQGELVLRGAM